ncbi:hypothetical protein PJL18_04270 [Paenarthrobacter nicotinovorans]|nr:hypothetical protein [Paenarthrobacter nicotinovorans]
MVARDRGVQGNDAESIDEVAAVNRVLRLACFRGVHEGGAEVGPVVMVSHGPDRLGTQGVADRLYHDAEALVGFELALVREVAGKNDGRGLDPGSNDLLADLLQPGRTVD